MISGAFTIRHFRPERLLAPRGTPAFPSKWENDGKPLDLEMGCGAGWHPIRYAMRNPDRNLIAIERTRIKFAAFWSRLVGHPELPNLLPVHADAMPWLVHELGGRKFDRVFFFYPNPEPKASNRRWIRSPFFGWLRERAAPGCEFRFASNQSEYLEEVLDFGVNHWGLRAVFDRSYDRSNPPDGGPRTHFEKKYLASGQVCREVRLALPPQDRPRSSPSVD